MNKTEFAPMLTTLKRYTKAWEKAISSTKEALAERGIEPLPLDPGIHMETGITVSDVFELLFDNGSRLLPWVSEDDVADPREVKELTTEYMRLLEEHCDLDYAAQSDAMDASDVALPPEEYKPVAPTLVLTSAVIQSALSAVPEAMQPFRTADPADPEVAQTVARAIHNLSFLFYQLSDALYGITEILDPGYELFYDETGE